MLEENKFKLKSYVAGKVLERVKAGIEPSRRELMILDSVSKTANDGERLSIHSLALKTGLDDRTVRKRLVDAGLFPPNQHPSDKVVEALKPKSGGNSDVIRDKRIYEQWRKLKLENDETEATLISRAGAYEAVARYGAAVQELENQKLVNEWPAVVTSLDVAAAREYGRKLCDELSAERRALAAKFADKEKA